MNERDIFIAALQLADAERAAYLEGACGGDSGVRQRVDALMRAFSDAGSFLQQPAAEPVATIDQPPTERQGALIGPYKLLEQIGEGGMGLVYMAEQQQPVRRLVALKLVKPGFDSKQTIARFEAERQALAMMDHPNIAKVLEAGTTEAARPYFVMELVRGIPINEFCDQKRLPVRERLELFIQVCQAVQHAHQKGIIHRDLKPTNVLVTLHDAVAVPKVIDFGIAKALGAQLTEHTLHTGFAQLVGTPLYMSPEQAEMNQLGVDTRSDVYSLGVLLYELLTGTTPFDKDRLKSASFDEMRRIIREEQPETVSVRLAKTRNSERGVRNEGINPKSKIQNLKSVSELDWIVMKSLEKDRSRRYESASALAADIQRFLSDEPVLACPPTTMYRFQKFARKHKPALATAAAIALCLMLGTTVSAWQAVRATTAEAQAKVSAQKADDKAKEATQERDEAQKQRDEVKALADKLAAKEEELQRTLYEDHIDMAKAAWDNGIVSRAASLLNRHRPKSGEPDRRGFEWHYLNRLVNIGPLISINTPNTPRLRSQEHTLSPDRTRLIRFQAAIPQSRNGERVTTPPTLHVWNLQTGQEELTTTLSGAPDIIGYGRENGPIFSPDATRMAIGNSRFDFQAQAHIPGDLKIWDTQTGKVVLSQSGVVGKEVVFSPDSKLLVSVMENQSVKLWDMQTGQERLTLQGRVEPFHLFVFSPNSKRLAAASFTWDKDKKAAVACEVRIWDVQTGRQELTLKGSLGIVGALTFSPDGQRLAGGVEETGTIKLWDSQTGNDLMTLQSDSEYYYELTFNADGTRLIARGEKEVQDKSVSNAKLWNALNGQEILSFQTSELFFSPDGKRVAMADSANHRTKVFDAQSGQIMLSVADAGGQLAFSLDSKRLATQSGGMRIWDLETGDQINHIKGFAGGFILAFSSDGNRLIGSSALRTGVWDVAIEQQSAKTLTLSGINSHNHSRGVSPAVFSPDLTRIAGISSENIKIFDAQTGNELRTLGKHDNNVLCVAFSPDGKRVASSDGRRFSPPGTANPGAVKVWDVDTGKELYSITGLDPAIPHLRFSPDGKKLTGAEMDRTIKVWDAQSGRELINLGSKVRAPGSPAFPLFAFSPDGKRLAGPPGKIWDAETGQEVVTLKGAQDVMAFSPDGKRVAGAASPGVHGIWDAETGERIHAAPGGNMDWVTFSPDGKRLAFGGGISDAQTGKNLLSLRVGMSGQVAFSPDGNRLGIVKAMSNEVTIYDATPLPEKP